MAKKKEAEVKYYTITPEVNYESALQYLGDCFGLNNLVPMGTTQQMMGTQKVLSCKISGSINVLKIEGPGFVVERIYERLVKR
jgi:hypothetical protein